MAEGKMFRQETSYLCYPSWEQISQPILQHPLSTNRKRFFSSKEKKISLRKGPAKMSHPKHTPCQPTLSAQHSKNQVQQQYQLSNHATPLKNNYRSGTLDKNFEPKSGRKLFQNIFNYRNHQIQKRNTVLQNKVERKLERCCQNITVNRGVMALSQQNHPNQITAHKKVQFYAPDYRIQTLHETNLQRQPKIMVQTKPSKSPISNNKFTNSPIIYNSSKKSVVLDQKKSSQLEIYGSLKRDKKKVDQRVEHGMHSTFLNAAKATTLYDFIKGKEDTASICDSEGLTDEYSEVIGSNVLFETEKK